MHKIKTFFDLLLGKVTGTSCSARDHVGKANAILQQSEVIKGSEGFGNEARQEHTFPCQKKDLFISALLTTVVH